MDAAEAGQLYDLLEKQVIPEFYSRDQNNVPRAWVSRVRESMASLTTVYSANRSVREYTERCYLPAAASYRLRAQNKAALGAQISDWRRALEHGWPTLRFGRVTVDTRGDRHYFNAEVDLGLLTRSSIKVELYADALGDVTPFRQEMQLSRGSTRRPRRALIQHKRAGDPNCRRLHRAHYPKASQRIRTVGSATGALAAMIVAPQRSAAGAARPPKLRSAQFQQTGSSSADWREST